MNIGHFVLKKLSIDIRFGGRNHITHNIRAQRKVVPQIVCGAGAGSEQ